MPFYYVASCSITSIRKLGSSSHLRPFGARWTMCTDQACRSSTACQNRILSLIWNPESHELITFYLTRSRTFGIKHYLCFGRYLTGVLPKSDRHIILPIFDFPQPFMIQHTWIHLHSSILLLADSQRLTKIQTRDHAVPTPARLWRRDDDFDKRLWQFKPGIKMFMKTSHLTYRNLS